jgi:uncharacterized Zn-finger protein
MRPEPLPVDPAAPPAPPEVIVAHEHRVWCDGGGGALGHPRVYMEMGDSGFVECGYCDRRFVLAGGPADGADQSRLPDIAAGSS